MRFDSVICFDLLEYLPSLPAQLLEFRHHVCEAVDKDLSANQDTNPLAPT
ncbi:hypothetical protein OMCYN_00043 [cyanobiont of Ornithocercus magnificus]|nr:hypothetical protein OMCYN_00043 [cyanobiont of Ornithocercus magnificus]